MHSTNIIISTRTLPSVSLGNWANVCCKIKKLEKLIFPHKIEKDFSTNLAVADPLGGKGYNVSFRSKKKSNFPGEAVILRGEGEDVGPF